MHNENFKSKVLIYGIFLILPLLFLNLGNKDKVTILKQQTKNDNFKSKINVIIYQIPDTYSIVNLSIISKNEIFIFTNKKIFYFDGKRFYTLYEADNKIILTGDSDGKFLVFSEDNFNFKTFIKPELYITKIVKRNKKISITKLLSYKTKFSHTIYAVKFIKPKTVFISSILEYSVFTLSSYKNLKVTNYRHYILSNDNSPRELMLMQNNAKNLLYSYSTRTIFYLNPSDNSPKLKLILNLGNASKDFNTFNEITSISIYDTTFGSFKMGDNSLFGYNKSSSSISFYKIHSLKINNGINISPTKIVDMKFGKGKNIWILLNNGTLLRNVNFSKDLNKVMWQETAHLRPNLYSKIYLTGNNEIWIYGENLSQIVQQQSGIATTETVKNTVSGKFLFFVSPLENIGSIYGSAIVNINGTGFLYTVDIFGADQLLVPPFFNKDLAEERGIVGKDENVNNTVLKTYQKIGVTVGDIDESGSDDIILSRLQGNNTLYLNNGTGYFRDATDEYGLNKDTGRSECSILGDVNNDGYLDYFSTNFIGSNHLYINKKGAKFIDETNFAHLESKGTSISAAFGDINNDGFLDLYVGNWANENKMYLNNGDGTFRDFTSESGTGDGIFKGTNSVLFADFNNDGNLDLFVGNRAGDDKLFINDGKGHFTDISKECGIDSTLWTYGAAFGDFNNDGWIDLFIAYLGGIKIYKNLGIVNGKLKFKDFTNQYIQPAPSLNGYNTSVVTFDVGRDGDIDIFSGQYAGVGHFYKNLLNDGRTKSNYIEVKIAGSESNRSGVGTKIKLFRNHKLIGYREVNAGNGYASCSSKIQHFGLPSAKGNYTLEVFFPASKILKKIKVASNSFIIVHEHEGFVEDYYLLKKNIIRYIFSNEFVFEIIKFILLVIIVSLFVTYFSKKIKFLLGTETYKKIFPKQKVLLVLNSAGIYIFVLLLIIISKSVFFNPAAYINNSRNIFMNDLLPYIVTFLFLFFTLKTKYDNRLKKLSSGFLLENLFLSLKKFDHGEGMLMNINRLSLLVQNIGYTQKSSNVMGNPVFKRLELAIAEFKTTVYPELIKISIISKDIELIFKQNFKRNKLRFSTLILRYTKDLKNSLVKYSKLYNQISASKDLSRKKTEILDNIQNLKNIVYNLSSETNKQFGCNVNDTINSVITKFNYNYGKTLQIGFNNYNGNITALIPSNELSEVVATIFLNSVEEFDLLNKKDKLLDVTCSKNNTSVIILIEDNGRGVPENLRNKIFEEGFSTKNKGHGFGLSFSRKCIEKFGGKIYCEKSKLGGAKFVIELTRL